MNNNKSPIKEFFKNKEAVIGIGISVALIIIAVLQFIFK